MQSIWFFIKTTVKGGVLFFLPLVFISIAIEKVIVVFTKVIAPLALKWGINNFAGEATITLLIALVVVLICFLGGLLMRVRQLKKLNQKLDEKLTELVPTYAQLKSKTVDKMDVPEEDDIDKHNA